MNSQPVRRLRLAFDVLALMFLAGMGSAIVYGLWSFTLEYCA